MCGRIIDRYLVGFEKMKKFAITLLTILLTATPILAKNNKELKDFNATMHTKFTPSNIENVTQFKTQKLMTIEGVTIPQRSIITLEIINAQEELRWHKSGYFIAKIINFQEELKEEPQDISDKEIYILARSYEPINKKEAWIIGTEILLTQGASFFAPGVDVLYFFTKGAITKYHNQKWYKAGVHCAYDNSIFWFPQKGKDIELEEGDLVKIKLIQEKHIQKHNTKIEKRKARITKQTLKKNERLLKKEEKRNARKLEKEQNILENSKIKIKH